MFQLVFTISKRQTAAITRVEWTRSVWLRVELGQSFDNFTTWFRIFQLAREAT